MKYWASILLILILSANSISQLVENASITIDRNMMSRSVGTSLQGKWMFKFESGPETLQEVPKSWIYYSKNKENLPSTGTGVYKIQINNPQRISIFALLFYGVSVEYKVLVNEKLIHRSKGYLTTTESDGVPARSRDLIPIPNNHETIDLTIEVSNEVHSDGGLTKAPVLGLISKLEPNEINRSNFEMVQIGCLLLMAVYNLILFFQFKNSSYIYLSHYFVLLY